MSSLQKSDKAMRVLAIFAGVVTLIEAISKIIGFEVVVWGFGIIGGGLGIAFAIAVIILGIHPIHYTPVILGALGILIIVFGVLIGGIFVLLAAFLGAIS